MSAFDDVQWREVIKQYADIKKLDTITLNKLVRQIVVHEKIGTNGVRKIKVEIHFNMRPPEKRLNNEKTPWLSVSSLFLDS